MPGALPFIPLIAAGVGMIGANSQAKAANASADQHYAQAKGDAAAANAQAQAQLQAYQQAHPNPINSVGRLQAPGQLGGGHIGGGTLNVNGSPQGQPQGQQQVPDPQMIQALLAMLMQHAGNGQQAGGGERRADPPGYTGAQVAQQGGQDPSTLAGIPGAPKLLPGTGGGQMIGGKWYSPNGQPPPGGLPPWQQPQAPPDPLQAPPLGAHPRLMQILSGSSDGEQFGRTGRMAMDL